MSQLIQLTIDQRVQTLEDWRKLTVDPTLTEHTEQLQVFQRMEQQWAGMVRLLKALGSGVLILAGIVEVTRAVLMMLHLLH